MTRLAIITDVHADVHALRDALAQIDKLGVDQILCCGDLLDYGFYADAIVMRRSKPSTAAGTRLAREERLRIINRAS